MNTNDLIACNITYEYWVYNYVHLIIYMYYTYTVCVNKVTIQYSNYSAVSFSHYCSLTVVLTVIGVLVNRTPQ